MLLEKIMEIPISLYWRSRNRRFWGNGTRTSESYDIGEIRLYLMIKSQRFLKLWVYPKIFCNFWVFLKICDNFVETNQKCDQTLIFLRILGTFCTNRRYPQYCIRNNPKIANCTGKPVNLITCIQKLLGTYSIVLAK